MTLKTSFYNVSRKSINHLWFVNFNAWHYSFPEATSYDKSKEASSLFQSEMVTKLEKRHKKLHLHVYHKTKTKHKLTHQLGLRTLTNSRGAQWLCSRVQSDQQLRYSLAGYGAEWLSGRVLDSRPRGRGLEPHRRH